MVRFEECQKRFFRGVFVCRVCKAKIRAPPMKIIAKEVKCRRCNKKAFRPLKSKK